MLLLVCFAYRPLFVDTFGLLGARGVERWLFASSDKSPAIVVLLAAWLLWRRRGRLLDLPARCDGMTAAAFAAAGTVSFVWAYLAEVPQLLPFSLACNLLGLACAIRGRPGARAVTLPALVLLLAASLPDPIRQEIVWRLQLWSARDAAWLLQALGTDVVQSGIVFRSAERNFAVIEACSGFRNIENLVFLALIVREFFPASATRQWLLVAVAPCLGYLINLLRVILVASSPDADVALGEGEHIPQGLAMVLVGTAILYGLGRALDRLPGRGAPLPEPRAPQLPRHSARPWTPAVAWLSALAVVSVAVPALPVAEREEPVRIRPPGDREGWSGEELPPDVILHGALPRHGSLYRRYERSSRGTHEIVDLFVGLEVDGYPTAQIFTSRLPLPGSDWRLEEIHPVRLSTLRVDADVALAASSDGQQAVVYAWRLRDGGWWWEALRSFLALDRVCPRRAGPRAVVRLVAYLPRGGGLARGRARASLDRFLADFHQDLAEL